MKLFLPEFEGELEVGAIPQDFIERLARRVENGLLVPGRRTRANYVVRDRTESTISFGAATWGTAINVGFNEVAVQVERPTRIRYRAQYWRWTAYVVGLCGSIGLVLAICLLYPSRYSPQLHKSALMLAFMWGMVVFWGLLWPWILVALHKKPAARCLDRILREEATRAR